jgi:para-nitrobenzyl esterase
MKPTRRVTYLASAALLVTMLTGGALAAGGDKPMRVKTASGVVEGTTGESPEVRAFRGIPFAAPPVGDLRWKPPQPVKAWEGVRQAVKFGPRCMQHPVFGDMAFRSDGTSEDCLYLNVWAPASAGKEKLPVLVYFYGGGFMAGDGSEPRYDGDSMARKGVIVVTTNYRLGAFGFFAHPELTRESPHHASGNYGLLDQTAALRWVKENIAAFGGDPARVTIAGESAGSASVSAHMASPLSKNLIAGAIGESGAMLSSLGGVPHAQAEQSGVDFAKSVNASSLAALRAMTTQQVMDATKAAQFGRFPLTIDGYFLTESPAVTFAEGRQSHVPLLVGWNSEEMTWQFLLRGQEPTPANYEKVVRGMYNTNADEVLKLYPGASQDEVISSATDLAGDLFIAYGTWKWSDVHGRTGTKPVYRYFYARPRPPMTPEMGNATAGLAGGVVKGQNAPVMPPARGAVHSAEIEYAMGNLSSNKVFAWTPDDFKVSKVMQEYFANFVKTGNPNGTGLPTWPTSNGGDTVQFMRIDVESGAEADRYRNRYLLLDRLMSAPPK